jgi:hypothetical protein
MRKKLEILLSILFTTLCVCGLASATFELSELDRMTQSHKGITFTHSRIHAGQMFNAGILIGSGTTTNIAFKVPATTENKRIHMVWEWNSESKAHFGMYKDCLWTTNTGTLIPIYNHNNNSARTSIIQEDKTATPAFSATSQVLQLVSSASGGTLIHPLQYTWTNKSVVPRTANREFVLENDTQYCGIITSDSGAKGLAANLYWYENVSGRE